MLSWPDLHSMDMTGVAQLLLFACTMSSTNSIVWMQAGLIQALAKVIKQGSMPNDVREALSEAVKHLTASSQKNRDTLVNSQALPHFIAQLQTGQPCFLLLCECQRQRIHPHCETCCTNKHRTTT